LSLTSPTAIVKGAYGRCSSLNVKILKKDLQHEAQSFVFQEVTLTQKLKFLPNQFPLDLKKSLRMLIYSASGRAYENGAPASYSILSLNLRRYLDNFQKRFLLMNFTISHSLKAQF